MRMQPVAVSCGWMANGSVRRQRKSRRFGRRRWNIRSSWPLYARSWHACSLHTRRGRLRRHRHRQRQRVLTTGPAAQPILDLIEQARDLLISTSMDVKAGDDALAAASTDKSDRRGTARESRRGPL